MWNCFSWIAALSKSSIGDSYNERSCCGYRPVIRKMDLWIAVSCEDSISRTTIERFDGGGDAISKAMHHRAFPTLANLHWYLEGIALVSVGSCHLLHSQILMRWPLPTQLLKDVSYRACLVQFYNCKLFGFAQAGSVDGVATMYPFWISSRYVALRKER